MIGALLGGGLAAGLVLVASAWSRTRRPTLEQRVTPYVRDVHPAIDLPHRPGPALESVLGPTVERLGDVLGGSASISRRLSRLGSSMTVEDFRITQLVCGAAGFGVAALMSAVLMAEGRASVPALLVLCAVGLVTGILWRDNRLSAQVTSREREMQAEFPVIADLLALAVAAGESPVAGLERVMSVSHGALTDELGRVVAEVRTGSPMADAFDRLAARTGVTSISRFAEGLAIAVERGTPLVDVLHAQAADVRESGRRELIEAGGRKEIAMMIPVVFLILPVTVVFAFFPGYIGLHLTSGL